MLHQRDVFLHAFAAVRRAVRDGQLQLFVPELEVLLDVVARAVGHDARLSLAAEQLVDRHAKRIAGQVPQRQIHTADGVNDWSCAAVIHGRPPHNVPQPLDVERVLVHQQLGEMLLDNRAAGNAARAIALDAFVG